MQNVSGLEKLLDQLVEKQLNLDQLDYIDYLTMRGTLERILNKLDEGLGRQEITRTDCFLRSSKISFVKMLTEVRQAIETIRTS